MKTHPNHDPTWVRRMADLENNSDLSVGGLAHEVGMFRPEEPPAPVAKSAFARLIEFRRRDLRLTVEQLAERAEVDTAEVVSIELGKIEQPELRTVARLAAAGTYARCSARRI